MKKPSVFISSSREGLALARELANQLESTAAPTLWPEGGFHPGKTATESLTEAADRVDFAVFILTADDSVTSTQSLLRLPRPNVLFELGFLSGRIGLSRTFLVVPDAARADLPSDVTGMMYLPLANTLGSDLAGIVAPAAAAIRKVIGEVGIRGGLASEYSSCFISYSWNDKDFAAHLHDDLQKVGVRCWLDAKEMRIGGSISDQIQKAIQAHDKVLLILSRASVRSSWVRQEIGKAFELERTRRGTVLFPLRLDDSILELQDADVNDVNRLKERFIIDFSHWHDKREYQRAFSRLVRDLAINASIESERQE